MNELKSIIPSLCPSRLIFFFSIMIFISAAIIIVDDKHIEIIREMPSPKDFEIYFNALEKTVNFCLRHKIYVDLNLEFGLFLVNVNLKKYLQEKQNNLPEKTRIRLKKLLLKIDDLANYFHFMIQKNKDVDKYKQDIKITELFYNASTWPRSSDKFNIDLLEQTTIYSTEELENMYGKWNNYFNNVNDFNKYKPTPKESDKCIAFLGRTLRYRYPSSCGTPRHCKNRVQEGSQFGYGLSHRILFMAVARFSRNCIVISENDDKLMTDKYCSTSFDEAQYIASNNFKLPDLIFEQIALCGLFGHAQFLKNSWLKSLLQFQTSVGCFSETKGTNIFKENQLKEGENDKWMIVNSIDIMNGQCNGHFTAVAAATLSQALRYIIETYYE